MSGLLEQGENVKVNASIIVKDADGKPQTKKLTDEPGVIKKVAGDDLYVATQYGTHFLHKSLVSINQTTL